MSFALIDTERPILVFQLFCSSSKTVVGLYGRSLPYRCPGGTAVAAVASDRDIGRPSVPVVG